MEPNPSGSTGLQFHKRNKGGFLGPDFKSKAGLPVINIPGCPAHPDWITQILVALATGRTGDISLDDLQRPETFFKTFTQTGCCSLMRLGPRPTWPAAMVAHGAASGCGWAFPTATARPPRWSRACAPAGW
jgi:hypothetical protein